MNTALTTRNLKQIERRRALSWVKRNYAIYLMLLPALVCTFVFAYMPMPGILVAFRKYEIFKGPYGSPWGGLLNIRRIFTMPGILRSIWNTLYISSLSLVIGFPAPILLAFLLNEMNTMWFKRTVQTISYMPHFLSWISVIGIAANLYSINGTLNDLRLIFLGPEAERILFLSKPGFFVPNVMILSLWKGIGWGSIVYLASITSIDPQLYEAAVMDGAGKLRQTWHITVPGILPTAVILLILQMGGLFNSNFELIYGLQNPFINFEVIGTIVFKMGIQQADYGLATAIGFLQGIMALILTFGANYFAKKITGAGIW